MRVHIQYATCTRPLKTVLDSMLSPGFWILQAQISGFLIPQPKIFRIPVSEIRIPLRRAKVRSIYISIVQCHLFTLNELDIIFLDKLKGA